MWNWNPRQDAAPFHSAIKIMTIFIVKWNYLESIMVKKDLAEIKKNGFIPQKQQNRFSLRLRVTGGNLSAGQLAAAAGIADEFGQGAVHLTSRQGMEIPHIKLEDLDKVQSALRAGGLESACVGPGVRTLTACQGSAICASGLVDSARIAAAIDRKFRQVVLPHKFKIGVTGCANDCLKAEENDLGVKGALIPRFSPDHCTRCGLCVKICPGKAIAQAADGLPPGELEWDRDKCLYCGRCVKSCPQACWRGEAGVLLYFGGVFGNRIRIGRALLPVITEQEDYLRRIGAALNFFARHGRKGERFAFTVERLGWDSLAQALLPEAPDPHIT
jgi:dissimilatory sulfite reductase (desulfoviridin) alpha/beta subunit